MVPIIELGVNPVTWKNQPGVKQIDQLFSRVFTEDLTGTHYAISLFAASAIVQGTDSVTIEITLGRGFKSGLTLNSGFDKTIAKQMGIDYFDTQLFPGFVMPFEQGVRSITLAVGNALLGFTPAGATFDGRSEGRRLGEKRSLIFMFEVVPEIAIGKNRGTFVDFFEIMGNFTQPARLLIHGIIIITQGCSRKQDQKKNYYFGKGNFF